MFQYAVDSGPIGNVSIPARWSFASSVGLTGLTASFLCGPPLHRLHSWKEVLLLAGTYLLLAAVAHVAAFLCVLCVPVAYKRVFRWRTTVKLAAGAWMAIAWFPLLALLTSEHSPWVALILPLAAVWAAVFLSLQEGDRGVRDDAYVETSTHLFTVLALDETPLWRSMLPGACTAVAVEGGIALLAARHAWIAGALFAAGAAYVALSLLRARMESFRLRQGVVTRASGGNTIAVWALLALALAPFLIGVSVALQAFVGVQTAQAASWHSHKVLPNSNGRGSQYSGIILLSPPKPHTVVRPVQPTSEPSTSKPHVIPFDGTYWYFQQPDTRPSATAHIAHGDPVINQIQSNNRVPLIMEAHQQLAEPLDVSCCRVLRLDVVNGDAVPGQIKLEVLLKALPGRTTATTTLGEKVLASSTVKPMPLHREPVQESLQFEIPRNLRGKSIDEITVRLKPEAMRSFAGARVRIQDFALEP